MFLGGVWVHQRELSMEMSNGQENKAVMNHTHALKTTFENLIFVEANWVVCWQGLLMRSPEACFHLAAFCCSISSWLEPTFWGISLPCLLPHGTYNSKGVSFSSRQDSTRKHPRPQNKEAELQPTSLSPLTSQNIPSVTVRLGGSTKLTGQWSKIHKSPPRRQR